MATPTLAEARTALAEALDAPGYVPEVIDPPCRVIEPGDPYLSQDAESLAWDTYLVTVYVYVLVPDDDNEATATALDAALLKAYLDIEAAGWSVTRVGKPGMFIAADWQHYGVQLVAHTRVARTT